MDGRTDRWMDEIIYAAYIIYTTYIDILSYIYIYIYTYIYIYMIYFLHPTVPLQPFFPHPPQLLSGLHELWSLQPGLHLLHTARQGARVAVTLGDHPLQQPGTRHGGRVGPVVFYPPRSGLAKRKMRENLEKFGKVWKVWKVWKSLEKLEKFGKVWKSLERFKDENPKKK